MSTLHLGCSGCFHADCWICGQFVTRLRWNKRPAALEPSLRKYPSWMYGQARPRTGTGSNAHVRWNDLTELAPFSWDGRGL